MRTYARSTSIHNAAETSPSITARANPHQNESMGFPLTVTSNCPFALAMTNMPRAIGLEQLSLKFNFKRQIAVSRLRKQATRGGELHNCFVKTVNPFPLRGRGCE